MKHQWENQHKQAVLCCHYLSCTLHGRALAKEGVLQHSRNQFTFLGMIHHIARALWTLLPTYPSLSRVICRQLGLGEDHSARNISVRHLSLMFVSSLYHSELLMTNDVLRRNHIIVLDNEEHFKKKEKKKAITALLTDHPGDLICSSF